MTNECNACYEASTEPAWVAQFVTLVRVDQPCKRHRPAAEVRSTDTTEAAVESLPAPCSDECGWCGENMPFATNERGE